MNTIPQLLSKALATQDTAILFSLFVQATEVAKFNEAQLAFSKARELKLKEQVDRQTAMIANLEKTLWKK